MLAHGQSIASIERFLDVLPGFVDERARRAVNPLGIRKLLMEAVAVRERPRSPGLLLHDIDQLIENPPADPARPCRVTNRGKTDDADRVQAAAAQRLLGRRKMSVGLRNEDL